MVNVRSSRFAVACSNFSRLTSARVTSSPTRMLYRRLRIAVSDFFTSSLAVASSCEVFARRRIGFRMFGHELPEQVGLGDALVPVRAAQTVVAVGTTTVISSRRTRITVVSNVPPPPRS